MPTNQVSGAVGYLVGSGAALTLSILVHSTHLRGAIRCVEFCDTDCSAVGTDFVGKIDAERV